VGAGESELLSCDFPIQSTRNALLVEMKNRGTNEGSELLRHTNK
jgi:hypothetical protein